MFFPVSMHLKKLRSTLRRICTDCSSLIIFLLSADSDFTSLSQSLTFASGETVGTSRCLSINILDDEIVEADETFHVILSFTGAVQAIGNTTANITIYPDSDCKLIVYKYTERVYIPIAKKFRADNTISSLKVSNLVLTALYYIHKLDYFYALSGMFCIYRQICKTPI